MLITPEEMNLASLKRKRGGGGKLRWKSRKKNMSAPKMAARFVHVFNDKTVERKREVKKQNKNITFWSDTEIGNKEDVFAGSVGSRCR